MTQINFVSTFLVQILLAYKTVNSKGYLMGFQILNTIDSAIIESSSARLGEEKIPVLAKITCFGKKLLVFGNKKNCVWQKITHFQQKITCFWQKITYLCSSDIFFQLF